MCTVAVADFLDRRALFANQRLADEVGRASDTLADRQGAPYYFLARRRARPGELVEEVCSQTIFHISYPGRSLFPSTNDVVSMRPKDARESFYGAGQARRTGDTINAAFMDNIYLVL